MRVTIVSTRGTRLCQLRKLGDSEFRVSRGPLERPFSNSAPHRDTLKSIPYPSAPRRCDVARVEVATSSSAWCWFFRWFEESGRCVWQCPILKKRATFDRRAHLFLLTGRHKPELARVNARSECHSNSKMFTTCSRLQHTRSTGSLHNKDEIPTMPVRMPCLGDHLPGQDALKKHAAVILYTNMQ
jgi:hypothetical protein